MDTQARTREILRRDWAEFFDGFSRRHRGWLATLEEIGPEIGAQTSARQLAFEGIVAEPGRSRELTLLLGKGTDEHLEHPIGNPQRVWLETFPDGAEAALGIESAGGRKTVLSFPAAMPSEMVDGIARETPTRKPKNS